MTALQDRAKVISVCAMQRTEGGALRVRVRLRFEGRNLGEAFGAFVEARLAQLGLAGSVQAGASSARVDVWGPAPLVDMLEVACLLGPIESLVDGVELMSMAEAPNLHQPEP